MAEAGKSPKEWVKLHRGDADLLVLDPADASHGPAARVRLIRGEKPIFDRFIGSLDAQKAPHLLVAALIAGIEVASPNLLIQIYPYRVTPVLRQVTQVVLELVRPDRFVVSEGFSGRFGAHFEEAEFGDALPATVLAAQRKAQWLAMLERCEPHTVDLSTTILSGSRLGAGDPVGEARKTKLGLTNSYVEVSGSTLYIVTDEELDDAVVSRALDYTHCVRAHFVSPSMYEGALCAFSKLSGEDFGFGFVQSIDFVNLRAHVMCTAIPPVPVPMLKLGSFRIDAKGTELGELNPWAI